MNIEQELADARAEMIFREEQMHSPLVRGTDDQACYLAGLVADEYEAARDRYLALLAEKRIRDLAEICVRAPWHGRSRRDGPRSGAGMNRKGWKCPACGDLDGQHIKGCRFSPPFDTDEDIRKYYEAHIAHLQRIERDFADYMGDNDA